MRAALPSAAGLTSVRLPSAVCFTCPALPIGTRSTGQRASRWTRISCSETSSCAQPRETLCPCKIIKQRINDGPNNSILHSKPCLFMHFKVCLHLCVVYHHLKVHLVVVKSWRWCVSICLPCIWCCFRTIACFSFSERGGAL